MTEYIFSNKGDSQKNRLISKQRSQYDLQKIVNHSHHPSSSVEVEIDNIIQNSQLKFLNCKEKIHDEELEYYRKKVKKLSLSLYEAQLENLHLKLTTKQKNKETQKQQVQISNVNQSYQLNILRKNDQRKNSNQYTNYLQSLRNNFDVKIKKANLNAEQNINKHEIKEIQPEIYLQGQNQNIIYFQQSKIKQEEEINLLRKQQDFDIKKKLRLIEIQNIKLRQELKAERQNYKKSQTEKKNISNQLKYTRQQLGRLQKQIAVLMNVMEDSEYTIKNLDVYRQKCILQDQVIKSQREHIKKLIKEIQGKEKKIKNYKTQLQDQSLKAAMEKILNNQEYLIQK